MIIGIDIGGTTTDIVGLKDGKILNPISVKADDPITSAAGALGKFVEMRDLPLSEIRLIAATGVGAGQIRDLHEAPGLEATVLHRAALPPRLTGSGSRDSLAPDDARIAPTESPSRSRPPSRTLRRPCEFSRVVRHPL